MKPEAPRRQPMSISGPTFGQSLYRSAPLMSLSTASRRTLALGSAAVLAGLTISSLSSAAVALDPPATPPGHSSDSPRSDKPGKPTTKPDKPGKPATKPDKPGKPATKPDKPGKPTTKPDKPGKPDKPAKPGSDPAGNNGTIKIIPVNETDGTPDNNPHPGCAFGIEWYGFDEGADVVSTVSFAMHAPTSDVGLSVSGPSRVFVGGDPASGAGTDTGLDGRELYVLSFDGAPHPKQGYHVKVTVATPRSLGNDTKTKVFWVAPCAAEAAPPAPPAPETVIDQPDTGMTFQTYEAPTDDTKGVLGTQLPPRDVATVDDGVDANPVPLAVDAGEGDSFVDAVRSPLGLLVIGLGLAVGLVSVLLRRRTSA